MFLFRAGPTGIPFLGDGVPPPSLQRCPFSLFQHVSSKSQCKPANPNRSLLFVRASFFPPVPKYTPPFWSSYCGSNLLPVERVACVLPPLAKYSALVFFPCRVHVFSSAISSCTGRHRRFPPFPRRGSERRFHSFQSWPLRAFTSHPLLTLLRRPNFRMAGGSLLSSSFFSIGLPHPSRDFFDTSQKALLIFCPPFYLLKFFLLLKRAPLLQDPSCACFPFSSLLAAALTISNDIPVSLSPLRALSSFFFLPPRATGLPPPPCS